MATQSKNSIINAIFGLRDNRNIPGVVRVVANPENTVIDVSFDNRKYIGRLRLEWKGDKYAVYLMDKDEGKVINSDYVAAKGVYLLIKTASDARKFIKWYELLTQLAALRRTRS